MPAKYYSVVLSSGLKVRYFVHHNIFQNRVFTFVTMLSMTNLLLHRFQKKGDTSDVALVIAEAIKGFSGENFLTRN